MPYRWRLLAPGDIATDGARMDTDRDERQHSFYRFRTGCPMLRVLVGENQCLVGGEGSLTMEELDERGETLARKAVAAGVDARRNWRGPVHAGTPVVEG